MAYDTSTNQVMIPAILVNDVEVVDASGTNKKKIVEDPHRKRKRIAATHDLKRCGCNARDGPGWKSFRRALYDLKKDELSKAEPDLRMRDDSLSPVRKAQAENGGAEVALPTTQANQAGCLPTSPSMLQGSHSTGSNRKFDVAFPSSYYDYEACLNFYRDYPARLVDLYKKQCKEASPARFGDSSDSDSDESITSIASTASMDYDFINSWQEATYRTEAEVAVAAPHKMIPTVAGKGFLHAGSTEYKKYQRKQRTHSYRNPTPPSHILRSFYPELLNPPEHAFDSESGGLRREWLHEARPEFFDSKRQLQEYVIHKAKPAGLSQSLWAWLCGRDSKLPTHGPSRVALKVAIETAKALTVNSVFTYTLAHKQYVIRELTRDEDLEIERPEEQQVHHPSEDDRSLWSKMFRVEKKRDEKAAFEGSVWTPDGK